MKKIIIGTTKLMKSSINISNNINLIVNTYTVLFFKLLLRAFMLLDSFGHSRRASKTALMVDDGNGNGKDLEFTSLEIRKTIMAPKWLTYGMSTNLTRHAPKWKLANHGLGSRDYEVGIIKPSRGECMKDQ